MHFVCRSGKSVCVFQFQMKAKSVLIGQKWAQLCHQKKKRRKKQLKKNTDPPSTDTGQQLTRKISINLQLKTAGGIRQKKNSFINRANREFSLANSCSSLRQFRTPSHRTAPTLTPSLRRPPKNYDILVCKNCNFISLCHALVKVLTDFQLS